MFIQSVIREKTIWQIAT